MNARAAASRTSWRLLAAGLAVAAFALHLATALRFHAAGAFDPRQVDLLFDADAGFRFDWIVRGTWVNVDVRHPLYPLLTILPARALARLAALAGETDAAAVRGAFALVAGPLAAALRAVFLTATLGRLGLGPLRAAAVVALDQAAFASLLFGGTPEHFPMTATALTAALWVWTRRVGERRAPSLAGAVLLSFVAAGITITSALPVAAGEALALRAQGFPWTRAVLRAAAAAGIALAALAAMVLVLRGEHARAQFDGAAEFATSYGATEPLARAAGLPSALAHTYVAGTVGTFEHRLAVRAGARHPVVFTFETASGRSFAAGAFAALALAVASALARRSAGAAGTLARIAAVWVALHAVFHTFWGSPELFLYACHWAPALTLVLALAHHGAAGARRWPDLALLAAAGAAAAWNLAALGGILALLTG